MELIYKDDTKENVKKDQSTKTNIKCIYICIYIMYTNTDTLTNKMPELKAVVKDILYNYQL